MTSVVKPDEVHRASVTSTNGTPAAASSPAPAGHEFSPVRTAPWAGLHAALAVAAALYAAVAALRPHEDCRSYKIALYLHVALWFSTLVVDYVLKRAQHALRVAGYLEFYQRTYTLHRAPLYAASLTSALLLLAAPLELGGGEGGCAGPGVRAPVAHVAFLLAADALVLVFLHANYIHKVWSFNCAGARPDAHRQPAGSVDSALGGHRHALSQTADLLSRQADLIRHLREHNEKLSNQLSAANSELRDLKHRSPV